MTNSSYLQRLIGRMGAETAMPFTPPDVSAPSLYDPFAEAEMVDETITPPGVEPPVSAAPLTAPPPQIEERSEPLPLEIRERVVHEFSVLPSAEPAASVEVLPPKTDTPLAPVIPPFEMAHELPPAVETIEQVSIEREFHEALQPPDNQPLPAPVLPMQDTIRPPEAETVEQVMYLFAEPAPAALPVISMEAPVEPEAPNLTPLLETSAPQITIGDIVVEIVTKSEPARRGNTPPPRVSRPVEAPPPRAGVRSKRRFGLGQM